ncbi:MAG: hypothetical protein ACJ8F7_15400 [Gemmataceae bacterium]
MTATHPDRIWPNQVEAVRVSLAPVHPVERVLDITRRRPRAPYPIRLLVPGALVTPAEHAVESSPFGPVEVIFYVTAMAEGELPGARVELFRDGQHEILPLTIRGERSRTLWLGVGSALLLAVLLYLPACWPEAASGDVQRGLAGWLPNVLAPLAKIGQGFYAFLATTGKSASLSFIALLGMLLGLSVWAYMRRPQTQTVLGQPFQVTADTRTPTPLLTPVPSADVI